MPVSGSTPLALSLAAALVLSAASGGPRAAQPAAAQALDAEAAPRYRLSETWGGLTWQPEAGRFGQTRDLTVLGGAGGEVLVLDGRQRTVHVLSPEGRPLRLFTVPRLDPDEDDWEPLRLDGAPDGSFYLLLEGPYASDDAEFRRYRVDQLWPDGRMIGSFELTPADGSPAVYRDLAAGQEGRVVVSRMDTDDPFFDWSGGSPTPEPPRATTTRGVEVYQNGLLQARAAFSCQPDRLDLAPDGRLYVANRCPVPLVEPPEPEPGDPEPAQAGEVVAMPREEGVAVFGPGLVLERFVPFTNPEDLGAGAAGAFVSRNVEVYALGETEPLYSGPTTAINAAYFGRVVLNLEATAEGGLWASLNHCSAQGVLSFDRPLERPARARLFGQLDQPELEGPAHPKRLAAGEDRLALLQGRFTILGQRPDQVYVEDPFVSERQTVQLWDLGGNLASKDRLRDQLGWCGSGAARPARDLAFGGRDLYVLDAVKLQRRPLDGLATWTYYPLGQAEPDERPQLTAVAADERLVLALDVGRQRVTVLDAEQGTVRSEWPTPAGGALVDLALGTGRVYLADAARSRIWVHDLAGQLLADWPLMDGPLGLTVGPEGDVYVLGAGGWGLRYSPEGRLRAAWPLPRLGPGQRATDLTVDAAGAVYVAWARLVPFDEPEPQFGAIYQEIVDGGIWIFRPDGPPLPEVPALPPGACLAAPDKRASPAELPLGQPVTVSLDIDGHCPPELPESQTLFVVDSSRSMGFDGSLETARSLILDLLPQLLGPGAQLGLITFGSGARMDLPLGADPEALRQALVALEPRGDSQLVAGLELARQELAGPRGRAALRRSIVIVSDGAVTDDASVLATQLRRSGVGLYALLFTNSSFDFNQQDFFNRLVLAPSHLMIDPGAAEVRDLLLQALARRDRPGLFKRLKVEDRLPANMAYLPDSAQPAAAYDAARHALVWDLGTVDADDPPRLSFRVLPRACGTWPTNLWAGADYLDETGHEGHLVFPLPQVRVRCEPLRAQAYLPLLSRGDCLRRQRPADFVLVMDTSSSMAEAAGEGLAGDKLAAARAAAAAFLDALPLGRDRAAIVAFDAEARILAPLSADRARLDEALAALAPRPGTRIDLGLAAAGEVLAAQPRPGSLRAVILLTDGFQGAEAPLEAVLAAAADLRSRGHAPYAIALGDRVDLDLLAAVVGDPARLYRSPTAQELAAITLRLAADLSCAGGD